MYNQCTEERFLENVSRHTITVIRDDEHGRHLKFSNNGSATYAFEILNWPGKLLISGDCGTFVFQRHPDMFNFFRSPEGKLFPTYWHEKVLSADRDSGVKEFSTKIFEETVKEYFENSCLSLDLTETEKAEVWEEIESEVISASGSEESAVLAVNDFSHDYFDFDDFWEHDIHDFTSRYIWCCRAIVWAINQYDLNKQQEAA